MKYQTVHVIAHLEGALPARKDLLYRKLKEKDNVYNQVLRIVPHPNRHWILWPLLQLPQGPLHLLALHCSWCNLCHQTD